jgi:hypothetical protein
MLHLANDGRSVMRSQGSAETIGLSLPRSPLPRVDEVIE